MEENKKKNPAVENGNKEGGNGNGGRKRRNRNRHKNGGNGGNPNAPAQNAQPQQNQGKPQQPQKQKGEQGKQNPQNQNGDKHKNKQGNGNNGQNQNNQPQKNQPHKGQQPQKGQQNNKNNGKDNKSNEKKEENRKDTYLYVLDGNLYVNLTNKCSNACDFCVRNERSSYYGNYLWLKNDPSAEKVMAAANGYGDLTRFKEVVFCGFGEPTYRLAEMVALCDYFHEKGLKTRLNTNGQGNLINKRDITPDLKGKIDFVNISLNASCYEKYQKICRSQYREAGFDSMIEFAKLCRRNGIDCRFSIVDCIGEEEVQACKYLAESVKIPLYVRKYIQDS